MSKTPAGKPKRKPLKVTKTSLKDLPVRGHKSGNVKGGTNMGASCEFTHCGGNTCSACDM